MDLTAPINKDNSCLINDVTVAAKFGVHNVPKSKLMYTCNEPICTGPKALDVLASPLHKRLDSVAARYQIPVS